MIKRDLRQKYDSGFCVEDVDEEEENEEGEEEREEASEIMK